MLLNVSMFVLLLVHTFVCVCTVIHLYIYVKMHDSAYTNICTYVLTFNNTQKVIDIEHYLTILQHCVLH